MNKIEIRKRAQLERKSLSEANLTDLNAKLLTQFTLLDFSQVKIVHIFLPIKQKNEPDTFLIIDWLSTHHPQIKILVPKADFETMAMSSHVYQGLEDLKTNAYDIPEPQQAIADTDAIDLVIVPLLAFDERGYRVGYGKGFYDRFLAGSLAKKVGLSFFAAIDVIDDIHENDMRLDKCITPDKTYVFPVV